VRGGLDPLVLQTRILGDDQPRFDSEHVFVARWSTDRKDTRHAAASSIGE
jgi:hypothetical protein